MVLSERITVTNLSDLWCTFPIRAEKIMDEIEDPGIAVDDIADDPKKLEEKAKLEVRTQPFQHVYLAKSLRSAMKMSFWSLTG